MKSKTIALGITAMFLTGFTALLYQILWIRVFASILGGNVLSISCVIAHFMLGLGIGNILAPKILKVPTRKAWPLYSFCEFGIVLLVGISFWVLFEKSSWLLDFLSVSPLPRIWTHFLLTGILILPATLLMGFSFPLISYVFPNSKEHQWLYAANCCGGALGALLSYAVLIYSFGLIGTLMLSLAGNLIAGAMFLRQRFRLETSQSESKKSVVLAAPRSSYVFAVALSALSGFFLLSLEQVWFRLGSMMIGGRIYVHSIILAIILLCLGVGAWISPILSRKDQDRQLRTIVIVTLMSLLSGIIGFYLLPEAVVLQINPLIPSKKELHPIFFAVMFFFALIPSLGLGLCFPLSLDLIQKNLVDAWAKTYALSQALYLNTAMSVLGSLLTTYFLFNWLGTIGTLKLLFVVLAILSIVAACLSLKKEALAAVIVLSIAGAGVVLTRQISLVPTQKAALFEAEDEYGYLNVLQIADHLDKNGKPFSRWGMFQNYIGLVGAYGEIGTVSVQHNLAIYPSVLATSVEDVLVVGMGFGLTTEAFTMIPEVKKITSIELLPAVFEAQKNMSFKDNSYLQDPRVMNIVDDGRSYIAQSLKKWDVICVNIDPYGAGATNLFSTEFYGLVLDKLKPAGIYSQLFFGTGRDLVHMLLTARSKFPYSKIMPGYEGDGFIFIGSKAPLADWQDSSLQMGYLRVQRLLPNPSWYDVILKSNSDFSAAEEIAAEESKIIFSKHEAHIIRDRNLRVELDRTAPWDLFLRYPGDYY